LQVSLEAIYLALHAAESLRPACIFELLDAAFGGFNFLGVDLSGDQLVEASVPMIEIERRAPNDEWLRPSGLGS
jgi:tRNA C32,U32 (ribose-2'-O)-methylase TrmJ